MTEQKSTVVRIPRTYLELGDPVPFEHAGAGMQAEPLFFDATGNSGESVSVGFVCGLTDAGRALLSDALLAYNAARTADKPAQPAVTPTPPAPTAGA